MILGKTNIFNQSGRSNEAPTNANYRGVGLAEMIYSIENKQIHRCNEKLVLHVLDMLDTTVKSAEQNKNLSLRTTCAKVRPFLDDEIEKINFWKAFRFTITFCLITLPLVIFLGLLIALTVNNLTRSIKGPVIFISLLPFILSLIHI